MATPQKPLLQPYSCSNPECPNVVQPRRRSSSGDHWCSERACQAMRQRQLRAAARLAGKHRMTQEEERLELMRLALHGQRRPCPSCDLEDAIPGYLHRAAPGSRQICEGLGGAGRAAGVLWIDLVHPDRASA